MANTKRIARLRREMPLHVMMIPGVIILFIFSYLPMCGIMIAFQKYNLAKGLFGAQKWCGLVNFAYVFSLPNIWRVFFNTLEIAIMKIIVGTLVPICVALMLNECRHMGFKRTVQTMIYFPYFISWIILGGILLDLLSPANGIVNDLIELFGGERIYFLGDNRYFKGTLVVSDVWRNFGYNSVVYLAAITSIDMSLYEAASIDGAGRWKQTWHVTLPGMANIVILLMILNLGNLLNAGFDQVFNLYSAQVYESGDIIDTLVYRIGLVDAKFGPSTAVGLLKSVISFILISSAYIIAYKGFDYSVF